MDQQDLRQNEPAASPEPEALERELTEHWPYYLRVARNAVDDPELAADACQQAFLNCLQRRHQLVDGAALRPWLVRAVVNTCRSLLRRRRVERKHQRPGQVEHLSDPSRLPEEVAGLQEGLVQAMNGLPPSPARW